MPTFIVHHDGWFFEWSEISDSPRTYGMRREEFEAYYRDEYGADGMRGLPARLERALKYGTSSQEPMSAEDLIWGNRAGDDEAELTFEQVIDRYCVNRPADTTGGENG